MAQDMIDERNAMTELDLLLKDVLDKHANHIGNHSPMVLIDGCRTCEAYDALKAVLAIPEETYLPTSSKGYFHSGRNSMRDEIRTATARALGVEQ